jgi:hypothetical protein
MKIESYRAPKSSFLSMEKDMGIITDLVLRNKRLKKLLYYTKPTALSQPDLTDEQTYSLFGKHIKIVPKLTIDPEVLNYLLINFDNFLPNETNPEFRDNIIVFQIICHYDQWHLQDFALRPYKIAAELDAMLDGQKLTGIGQLHFIGAQQIPLDDEFGGLMVIYEAIHGGEDQKFMPNPADDEQFIDDFNELFNDD